MELYFELQPNDEYFLVCDDRHTYNVPKHEMELAVLMITMADELHADEVDSMELSA